MGNLQLLVYVSAGIVFIAAIVIYGVIRKKKQGACTTSKINSSNEIQITQGIDGTKITNENDGCREEKGIGSTQYNQLKESDNVGFHIELNLIECIDYETPRIDLVELLKINRIMYQEESSDSSLMAELLNAERFKKIKHKKNIKK